MIRPWVGHSYASGVCGRRLLLLGESNYCSEGDSTDIVRENVRTWILDRPVTFFTKAARLVLKAADAPHSTREQIRDLWQRIAFTNYVQRVLHEPRQRPSREDWVLGRPVLLSLLAELRPEVVVVLGTGLRDNLNWLGNESRGAIIVATAHPSSFGFKYADNVPIVRRGFLPAQ